MPDVLAWTATTRLSADPETVWLHATSLRGINRELAPWLRIQAPAQMATINDLQQGDGQAKAVLLLGGLLPVAWWRPEISRLELGHFVERSSLPWLSQWQHERRVRVVHGGCEISDHLIFSPRLAGMAPVCRAIVSALFGHRHRRLQKIFGS